MINEKPVLVALTALLFSAGVLPAQDPVLTDFPAPGYIALKSSTVGGLPPYLHRDHFLDRGSPPVLHLRYGVQKVGELRTHTAVATGEFHFFSGRLGITGGVQRGEEHSLLVAGIEYQSEMSAGRLTPSPTGPVLYLAFKSELGFSTAVDGALDQTAFAGGLSIPMTVPFGEEVVFVPFLAPGVGLGALSSVSGYDFEPQLMASAGVVVHNPSRIDLTIGAHRILAEDSKTVYGIGLTWNR